jgi:hypothetical protein
MRLAGVMGEVLPDAGRGSLANNASGGGGQAAGALCSGVRREVVGLQAEWIRLEVRGVRVSGVRW